MQWNSSPNYSLALETTAEHFVLAINTLISSNGQVSLSDRKDSEKEKSNLRNCEVRRYEDL